MNDFIERDELAARLRGGAPLALFEVLAERHWASGHLPGALAMPPDTIAEVAAATRTAKNDEIVVYCANLACRNSHTAAAKLRSLGYGRVRVYAGGKADWQDAGLALEVSP